MANQNFRVKKGLEVGLGGTYLYAEDIGVGINSTAPRSNLDVRGEILAERIVSTATTTTGIGSIALDVTGFSTFTGDVYIGGDLEIDGRLDFDSFEAIEGDVTGILTTNDFVVTGFSTFQKLAEFQDVNISGVITASGGDFDFANLQGNNMLFTGVGTFSNQLDVNNLEVSGVSTFVGIASFQDVLVDRNLEVNGITSLGAPGPTGFTTIRGDLYVGGDIFVQDDIVYDEITGRNLSISGVATIANAGIESASITDAQIGVATIGFSTTTEAYIGVATIAFADITDEVVGTSTVTLADITDAEIDLATIGVAVVSDAQVAISTIVFADITDEVVGTSTVSYAVITDEVVGTSTVTTAEITTADIDVANITDEVVGTSTITTADITTANVDVANITDEVVGTSTVTTSIVGFASIKDAEVGVATIGFSTTTDAYIGVATVSELNVSDLDVDQDLFVGRDLFVTGITTTDHLDFTTGVGVALTVGFASITDAYIGVSTVGFSTMDSAYIGVGTAAILNVTETSIFEGDLTVEGDATFNQNVAISTNLTVGSAVTIGNYLDVPNANIGVATVGFASITDENVGTSTIAYANISETSIGVATVGYLDATDALLGVSTVGFLTVTGNSYVAGLSTFVGFTTFVGDVSVGGTVRINGDLIVSDDIFKDEIIGRNLSISGVATINNLNVTGVSTLAFADITDEIVGTSTVTLADITDAEIDLATIGVAVVSDAQIAVATVGFATITDAYLGVATVTELNVSNLDVQDDLYVGRDLLVTGITTTDQLFYNSGIATQLTVGLATVTDLDVGFTTTTDIHVENLLYDSNRQVGAGDSVLATVGGSLVWTRPDLVGLSTEFEPGSTFYVNENGSDTNDGLSPEKPWASVSYALSQIADGSNNVLLIGAGEYTETFPLDVPDGLTVKGSGQRSTTIRPTVATETNDGFRLGNVSTVEDLTIAGMYKPTPGNSYAFVYRPLAAITTRSPYVQRVTVLNKGSAQTADDPFGYGTADDYPFTKTAAAGVLADGSLVDASSIEAGFLLNEVTIFCPKNTGVEMVNGARVEFLNGFTYFAEKGIYGRSDLAVGIASAGKTRLRFEGVTAAATDTIEYYDSDATTVLASGTVDSVDGTYVYLTNSGVGTFAPARNRRTKEVTFVNSAQISTAQSKFGGSSLDVSTSAGDAVTLAESSDFGFGTGDFTVEFWAYVNVLGADRTLIDFRSQSNLDQAIDVHKNVTGNIEVLIANSIIITSSSSLSTSQWYHIAIAKEAGTIRLFIDGALEGSAASALDLGASKPLVIGSDHTQADGPNGYIDEVRIEKGVAKYTGAFTAPTAALKSDSDTVLLLHFDGTNGDTTTSEDVITYQDIRVNATVDPQGDAKILLADYSQFGADLRSIGCAVEYGNFGVVAEGSGSTLRVMALNFNHVGAGGDLTNDPLKAIQSNEVIELSGGQVSYVSIDHKGDFRVGDEFYVNQQTGQVSFTDTVTDLVSLSSLTITDGTQSSLITPGSGRFGNILISGNVIESVTGNIDIETAGSGDVNIYANTNILGILTAQVLEANAITNKDSGIAIDDTGSDGTIRFITDGVEGFRLDNQQQVGIGTQVVRADLDVVGHTLLEDLTVTGIATINTADITTASIDVANITDEVVGTSTITVANITDANIGVATITTAEVGFATITDSYLGVSTIGFATMTNAFIGVGTAAILNVTQTSVFEGDLSVDGNLGVAGTTGLSTTFVTSLLDVNGHTELDTLNVSGLSTFQDDTQFVTNVSIGGTLTITGDLIVDDITYDHIAGNSLEIAGIGTIPQLGVNTFTAVDATIGVATITTADVGFATITEAYVGVLTVSSFNSLGGDTQIGDDITTRNLKVTGIATVDTFSEFVGVATFRDDVFFDQDITVAGAQNVVSIGATYLTVSGIATIANAGIASASIDDAQIGVATVTTAEVGFATITEAYVGLLTVTYTVGTSATFTNLVATNFISDGGGSNIGEDITTRNLEVTGLSTFVGDAEFQANVSVASSLTTPQLYVDDLVAGVGTITTLEFTDGVGTALTVTDLTVTNFTSDGGGSSIGEDITTRNLEVTGVSTFTGNSEFQSSVSVASSLTAADLYSTRLGTLELAAGIGTIVTLNFTDGVGTALTVTTTTISSADITNEVVGTSTITTAEVGFATITEAYVGIVTFADAVGTALTVTDLTVTNFTSDGGGSSIGEDITTRNLQVTGLSTFQDDARFDTNVSIGGTLTITGDLIVDDITYDTVAGNQLNITGVGTIANFVSSAATITDATIDFLTFTDGVGTALTITDKATIAFADITDAQVAVATVAFSTTTEAYIGIATIAEADLGIVSIDTLNVSGLSTFASNVDINADLDVSGNVTIGGTVTITGDIVVDDITYDTVGGNQLNIAGVGTIATLNFTNGVGTALTVTDLTYTNISSNGGGTSIGEDITTRNLDVTGIATVRSDFNVEGNTTVGFITATDMWVSGIGTFQDINSLSDRRVKENIATIEDPLSKVQQINGVTFNFVNSNKPSIGVIAQEVEKVFPELISGTFPKSVNYNGLIGLLIESVKELKAENESLRARVEKLEG